VDELPDTVKLANGGRVRGTVVEEDPQKGVTLKLGDGTLRKIPAKDVKQVEYGADAAKQAAPSPAPAAPGPIAVTSSPPPAPVGYVMVNTGSSTHRANPGLFVTGMVLTIVGATSIPIGGIALGVGEGKHCSSGTPMCGVGAGFLGGGVLFLGVGIPMLVVGGAQVPNESPGPAPTPAASVHRWWLPSRVAALPNGAAATWEM
jgi:hypothetical protein